MDWKVTARRLSWQIYDIVTKFSWKEWGKSQLTSFRRCSARIRTGYLPRSNEKQLARSVCMARQVITARSWADARHVVHLFTFIFMQFGKGKPLWRRGVLSHLYCSVSNRLLEFSLGCTSFLTCCVRVSEGILTILTKVVLRASRPVPMYYFNYATTIICLW